MERTPEQWLEIYREKNGDQIAFAEHVLGDLVGYRDSSIHRKSDLLQIMSVCAAMKMEGVSLVGAAP